MIFSELQSSPEIESFDFHSLSNYLEALQPSGTSPPDIVAWTRTVQQGYPPQDARMAELLEEEAQAGTVAMESTGYMFQQFPALSPVAAHGPYADNDNLPHGIDDTHDTAFQYSLMNPDASFYYPDGFERQSYGHQSMEYLGLDINATDFLNGLSTGIRPSDHAVHNCAQANTVSQADCSSDDRNHLYDAIQCSGKQGYSAATFECIFNARATQYSQPVGQRQPKNDTFQVSSDGYSQGNGICEYGNDYSQKCSPPEGSPPESQNASDSGSSEDTDSFQARKHPLYECKPDKDGLYRCPFKGKENCEHKQTKQKCTYDKYVDSHLKPYRCKHQGCEDLRFSSTACRLRHEREAHGSHGHGVKPYLCVYPECERSKPGNGFPRSWNCHDHMKRMHDHETSSYDSEERCRSPPAHAAGAAADQTTRKRSAQDSVLHSSGKRYKSGATGVSQSRRRSSGTNGPTEIQALNFQWLQHHHRMHYNVHHIQGPGDTEVLEQLNKDVIAMQAISRRIQQLSKASGPA